MQNIVIIDRRSPAEDLAYAGGKAANLHLLSNSGINVPEWFCISSLEFEKAVEKNTEAIRSIFSGIDFQKKESIDEASEKLKAVIGGYEIQPQTEADIEKQLQNTFSGSGYFAVRSSALGEDSASNSFAGQLDSFLKIQKDDILKYVKECWKSAYNPGLLYYCHSKGIDVMKLKTAVIIQKMIESRISGIIFTANPVGILNEAVIAAGFGLGEGVVSDNVPTDTCFYNRSDRTFRHAANCSSILDDSQLKLLIDEADKIQKLFDDFQDIEFAFDKNDKLFILQCRPITNLPKGDTFLFDNSNIVESYPGINSPLTFSFAKEAYFNIFRSAIKRLGASEKLLSNNDYLLQNMIGFVEGRIYYNLSTWYGIFKFMPFSDRFIPIWQEMLGVSDKTTNGAYAFQEKTGPFHTCKTFFNLLKEFLTLDSGMEKLDRKFNELTDFFNENYRDSLDNDSLYKLYHTMKNRMNDGWELTLFNDIYAFLFSAGSKSVIKKLKLEDPQNIFNGLLCGTEGMEGMKAVKSMICMAEHVRNNPKLLADLESRGLHAAEAGSEFSRMLSEHLEKFGDRSFEELKLETKTFREDPNLLLKRIIEYSKTDITVEKLTAAQLNVQESAKINISRELDRSSLQNKMLFRYSISRASRSICYRENSRLNRARFFGMMRKIFLSFGLNLEGSGNISSADDIFYLNLNEILDFVRGCSVNKDLKALIDLRKEAETEYRKSDPVSRLAFRGTPYNIAIPDKTNSSTAGAAEGSGFLTGTGCSQGIAFGEVAVVRDAANLEDIRGKILVTEMTDPGWVFLIAMANGIIVEKGSMLSHTAIIARELGIPAVVGVKDATSILKEGDKIKINGSTGEVTLL